ncbi:MAG: FAD-binding oxidoreductase [Clostridiales bacterium]|nr:FAD-binding oxidoreductase [Clostridiales bacterium]
MKSYDKIILGAGLYGLYAALFCGKKGERVLVLEHDSAPFQRATYINQARVHNGYHYPRSYSTAIKSKNYFDKFNADYGFCVHDQFRKIYATSKEYSWTNAEQFKKFSDAANIKCTQIPNEEYFKPNMCDGVFETCEYTYDAHILKNFFIKELKMYANVEFFYDIRLESIEEDKENYVVTLRNGDQYRTAYLLNCTYASTNQVITMLGYEPFKIKYELCEIILCKVDKELENVGITVMDGPFFSIMPFGKTGYHSLTSVTFTPHITSYDTLPTFDCQKNGQAECSPEQLNNCNNCKYKPKSAWDYMSQLARKYLKDDIKFEYAGSLFSMKPILMASEIDDSRPTVIKVFNDQPKFVSVLSGKINTVYDLDSVL